MFNFLNSLDINLTQIIRLALPHNRLFDLFFSFFSQNGGSILIWIALVIFILFFEERKNPGISTKDKQFIIIITLALITQAILVNIILKNTFQRPRPPAMQASILALRAGPQLQPNICPHDFSFPSGHAATAFCAAAILSVFDKKKKYLYYLIAFLIALSRIYLNCHYLGDVLAGGLIGWGVSWIYLYLLKTPIVMKRSLLK